MRDMNPEELAMLPWSIVGPRPVQDREGNRHFEMRVKELPDFLVSGRTEAEVLWGFKPALVAFLKSFLPGQLPPLPEGPPARWVLFTPPPGPPLGARVAGEHATTGATPVFASVVVE